jgi:hypothetical protein
MNYPRTLTQAELEFIRWLLPDECPVYRGILAGIESGIAVGEGRWGVGDVMVGTPGTDVDRSLGMSAVVAFGECMIGSTELSISIHEPNVDDLTEIQFSGIWPVPEEPTVTSGWTYSYWKPGMPCPATATIVREVVLSDSHLLPLYTLAISEAKRVVWLHHHDSGFNQLLSLTGFADEVFRTHRIRDANMVTHPAKLFERLAEFSDGDLQRAAIEYNKTTSRRFDDSPIAVAPRPVKQSFLGKLFGKNS